MAGDDGRSLAEMLEPRPEWDVESSEDSSDDFDLEAQISEVLDALPSVSEPSPPRGLPRRTRTPSDALPTDVYEPVPAPQPVARRSGSTRGRSEGERSTPPPVPSSPLQRSGRARSTPPPMRSTPPASRPSAAPSTAGRSSFGGRPTPPPARPPVKAGGTIGARSTPPPSRPSSAARSSIGFRSPPPSAELAAEPPTIVRTPDDPLPPPPPSGVLRDRPPPSTQWPARPTVVATPKPPTLAPSRHAPQPEPDLGHEVEQDIRQASSSSWWVWIATTAVLGIGAAAAVVLYPRIVAEYGPIFTGPTQAAASGDHETAAPANVGPVPDDEAQRSEDSIVPVEPTASERAATSPTDAASAPQPGASEWTPSPAAPLVARDPELAGDLARRGMIALRKDQLDEAEGLLDRAVAHDPRNAIALRGLAQLHVARGRHRHALKFAAKAVNTSPHDADLRILLGDAYFETLAYADARREYEKAAALGHGGARTRLDRLAQRLSGQGQP